MRKTKRMLRYTVIFEEAPEGGYTVYVPSLGCVTEGENFEEASAMAKDAIQCYVSSLIKHGEPVPEEGRTEIVASLAVPVPAVR